MDRRGGFVGEMGPEEGQTERAGVGLPVSSGLPQPRTSKKAITCLVLGLLAFFPEALMVAVPLPPTSNTAIGSIARVLLALVYPSLVGLLFSATLQDARSGRTRPS
jgi:hypothetical protein